MLLRVPPFDVPDKVFAERDRPVLVTIGPEERAKQVAPLGRGVQAIRVVEDVTRLVTHVHHDLAIGLEGVSGLLDRLKLGIGKIKRNAKHRLLVRASPLVCQITNGPKLLEPTSFELLVQLPNVTFDGRPFNA